MNNQEAKKLEDKLLKKVSRLMEEGKIILAISGGPDSVFLLEILKKLTEKNPGKSLILAHLNHKTRQETDAEENFIKKLENTNLIIETDRQNIPAISKKLKKGMEETGRLYRYKFLQKIAKKYHSKNILTAHHANDNLETIIMNFSRGASLQGLSGMKEKEEISKKLFLIRPLLEIDKTEILAYLKLNKIKFCKDQSNKNRDFTRNFIRLSIIPKLKKLNPNIVNTTAKNIGNIRENQNFVEETAKNWLKKNIPIPAKKFRLLSPALQKQIIREIFKEKKGSTINLENAHIEEILEMIHKNVGNKTKKFQNIQFSIKQNILHIA